MKKQLIFTLIILTLFSGAAYAAPTVAEEAFEEMYGSIKEKTPPRPIDDKAAALAKEYSLQNKGPDPSLGRGGAVIFTYGATMPRILCRPMRVVDIELEPGETVTTAPFIGDSINWQVLPASSGSGENLTMHVMVKPSMPDLTTNLVIHTSRRTYHLDLVSSNSHYTPHVAFDYPQQGISQNEWTTFLAGVETQKAEKKRTQPYVLPHEAEAVKAAAEGKTIEKKGDDKKDKTPQKPFISSLDYGYRIVPKTKNVKWLPAAVYTDGAKTYIQFPQTLRNMEAPVFMAVRNGVRELVNYRVIGNTYVIDSLIDEGVLLDGSGAYSSKVIIVKEKKPKKEETKQTTEKEEKKPYTYEDYLKERRAKKLKKQQEAQAALDAQLAATETETDAE